MQMQSSPVTARVQFGDLSYTTGEQMVRSHTGKINDRSVIQINVMATGEDVARYADVLKISQAQRGFDESAPKEQVGFATVLFFVNEGFIRAYRGTEEQIRNITEGQKALLSQMLGQLGTGIIGIKDDAEMEQCAALLQSEPAVMAADGHHHAAVAISA